MTNVKVQTPYKTGQGLYVLYIDNTNKIYHTYYSASCSYDFNGDIIKVNVNTYKEIKEIIKQLNWLGYSTTHHTAYLKFIGRL